MKKIIKHNNPTLEAVLKSACGGRNKHLQELQTVTGHRPSKYGNKKTVVDGINFDSVGEATRYGILKMRQKAGEIGLIECQVTYELNAGGEFSFQYIADFRYRLHSTGELIVEDFKGYRTATYKKKKRLMKKVHGIIIFETSK